jgi:hypothetical protein
VDNTSRSYWPTARSSGANNSDKIGQIYFVIH